MKFSKTLITTAILGFSLASFHSTVWADTLEQQFQQGFEAATRERIIKWPLNFGCLWQSRGMLVLNIIWA